MHMGGVNTTNSNKEGAYFGKSIAIETYGDTFREYRGHGLMALS